MSDAPVDPAEVPVFTGDLGLLEAKVKELSSGGSKVAAAGADVHKSFGGLSAYYKAPEAEQLFGVTKPVAATAHDLSDDIHVIAKALGTYAREITPLIQQLKQLRQEAADFRANEAAEDDWNEDGDLTDENLNRRNKIAEVWAAFQEAERDCHAKIIALAGGKALHTIDASHKNGYGYDAEALKQSKSLPWGDAVEESVPWWQVWEHAYDFGKGVAVDGVGGTVKGLLTMVGVDGWDAAGRAWVGLAKLSTAAAMTTLPFVGPAYVAVPGDKLPSWLRESRTALVETGKALVAWDQWGSNPSRAAGSVTFNVVTSVFTGGAGAAASGAGKAGVAAKALSFAGKAGKAGQLIDPMTYAAKGAGMGLTKVRDVMAGLKDMGKIEVPKLSDGALSLPEGSVTMPDGTVQIPKDIAIPGWATKLPDGGIALPEGTTALPEGAVKRPGSESEPVYMDTKGSLYNADGTLKQHYTEAPKEGAPQLTKVDPPRAEVPAEQPVLATVGGRGDEVIRSGSDVADSAHVGDNAGHGNAGSVDNTPMAHADDSTAGPSAGHQTPTSHTTHHGDGPAAGVSRDLVDHSGPGHEPAPGSGRGNSPTGGEHHQVAPEEGVHGVGEGDSARIPPGSGHGRLNEPLPELTSQERVDHWSHLDTVEQRNPGDFDQLQRDPDKNGGISEPSKDEARVGLDLREGNRLPEDIQRPTEADRGEFYSPSTGKYYDIKGVHSDWPPFNNVRDKSQPFRGAYNPSSNGRWVMKLSEQIVDKGRIVIIDVRNANQAAIDDIRSIVQKNGWDDDVIWYP